LNNVEHSIERGVLLANQGTKSKGKEQTPSFVCEVPLRTAQADLKMLNARLEAARQMYNALLGEGMRRLKLVRQSRVYNQARSITNKEQRLERATLFKEARSAYEFSEYALSRHATQVRYSWLGEHLDAHTVQKLAKRASGAVSRVASGKARRVRFKGRRGIHSVEGKSKGSAIKWKEDRVVWSGLELPMVKDARKDPVIAHGLSCPVKYVRLVRSAGGGVYEFNTRTTALSQVCHCGEKRKKPLSQRIHECSCGVTMQRDLYSAYLARFVENDTRQKCRD
jgi:putative transposase